MKRKTEDSIFVSIRFGLKWLSVHSFLVLYILIGGYAVFELFYNRKSEVLGLTYYGFAVYAVLSNICFSYCRASDDKNEGTYLRGLGERFLQCAIGFLIGSIINFMIVHAGEYFPFIAKSPLIAHAVEIIGGLFFTSSFFFAATAIHSLLEHLFEKLTLNKDNYHV